MQQQILYEHGQHFNNVPLCAFMSLLNVSCI